MRICICASQVPFVSGGAELHAESLRAELASRGFDVDLVAVPFSWEPHRQVLKSAFAWRLLQLQEDPARPIDLVITTKFPSYLIQHPNKVVWLVHQFRQVYDLLDTPYSDYTKGVEDQDIVRMVREMDTRALSECRARFTIAKNPAARLKRYNGLDAEPLYPPAPLGERYRRGAFGDYVFTCGRLDRMKRPDLLIRAMACTQTPVRARIAGAGPEHDALAALIAQLGLHDRVELLGRVDDDALIELYANSLAVFYAPYDEDYGYVTVEAFKSGKPVLTATDSGGVLEFVCDHRDGFVCSPSDPSAFAQRIDALYRDREQARHMGDAAGPQVSHLTWDHVIGRLTGVASAGGTR